MTPADLQHSILEPVEVLGILNLRLESCNREPERDIVEYMIHWIYQNLFNFFIQSLNSVIHIPKTSLFLILHLLDFEAVASFAMAWKQYYQVKHQSCKSFWHCSEKSINVIQVISCFKLLSDLKDVSCRCSKLFIGSNKRRDNVMTDARVQNWWWHPLSNTDKPTDGRTNEQMGPDVMRPVS